MAKTQENGFKEIKQLHNGRYITTELNTINTEINSNIPIIINDQTDREVMIYKLGIATPPIYELTLCKTGEMNALGDRISLYDDFENPFQLIVPSDVDMSNCKIFLKEYVVSGNGKSDGFDYIQMRWDCVTSKRFADKSLESVGGGSLFSNGGQWKSSTELTNMTCWANDGSIYLECSGTTSYGTPIFADSLWCVQYKLCLQVLQA